MEFGSRSIEDYSAAFANALVDLPQSKQTRIVVDYGFGRLSSVFPAMLGKLGWDAIALNAYSDGKRIPRTESQRQELYANLSDIVTKLKADAGLFIDSDGERFTLLDERGQVIDGASLLALFSSLVAERSPSAEIAVPVNAPIVIDDLLAQTSGKTLRTKADPRALMAAARTGRISLAGDINGGFVCPEFHPTLDAMFAASKLMRLVNSTGRTLSDLLSQLPAFSIAQNHVDCPWEQKGRIMRILTESVKDSADYTDGIRIPSKHGWTLVLPDPSEPYFHVYAESDSATSAESLVQEYTKRIRDIAA